jgi:carotenoid cleavage dioxygenase-like enzyme
VTAHRTYASNLPAGDVHPYRSGAWRPQTTEHTARNLQIEGSVPRELNGVYLRNTENPLFESIGRYHPFDGDGMVHMMSFCDGEVEYRNRFVQTDGLRAEIEAGHALWAGLAEPPSRSLRDGKCARGRMKDSSSTDIVVHAGVAVSSFYQCGDLYRLDPRTLDDLGKESWDGAFPTAGVSAHTKVDEGTGELLFFNYQTTAPYMHYGVVSNDRRLVHYVPIELPGARLPHDMVFTPNYSILNDCPLFWDPELIERGIYATRYHRDTPMRIGIIPRYGASHEIRWFDCRPTFVLHWINAWEEGDEVVVDGYFEDDPSPRVASDSTIEAKMFRFLDLHSMKSRPYRWRFNMKNGEVREGYLSDTTTEFGMINQRRAGLPYRYVYSVVPTKGMFTFDGLIKHDVVSGREESITFGNGVFGSETVVAPKPGGVDEDDAWLVTFTSDVVSDESHCVIYDAKALSEDPVVRIRLPERISSGTHACWAAA